MMFSSLTRNAFAVLQEESHVSRNKEKKEKALNRRAEKEQRRQQELKAKIVDTLPSNELAPNVKWSDVLDDDEEDDNDDDNDDAYSHKSDVSKNYEDTSEDFSNKGDDDELNHFLPNEQPPTAEIVLPNIVIPPPKNSNRPLSKKERLIKKQQENEDFDALLNDMGLTPKIINEDFSIENVVGNDMTHVSKKKKKKKEPVNSQIIETSESNLVCEPKTSEKNSSTVIPQTQSLTKEQAIAAAKKAAASKKSKSSCVVTETVLAEAKKKAELKKSKQKKEKYLFEH